MSFVLVHFEKESIPDSTFPCVIDFSNPIHILALFWSLGSSQTSVRQQFEKVLAFLWENEAFYEEISNNECCGGENLQPESVITFLFIFNSRKKFKVFENTNLSMFEIFFKLKVNKKKKVMVDLDRKFSPLQHQLLDISS